MPTYSIRTRDNSKNVHQLAINGNIVSVTRVGDPHFTLDLNLANNFEFVALFSRGQVTQRLLSRAIAFAKSNVVIHE